MITDVKDSAFLLAAGRNPPVPFRIPVNGGQRIAEMTCERVLRVVPGRRMVCSGYFQGREVVAKFFLDRRRGPYHLQRETAGLAALSFAGIPVPEIVFKGAVPPGRIPVLVLSRLSPAVSFSDAWDLAPGQDAQRDLLIRAVALVADQHRGGIKQDDLHKENFMICGPQVVVIDGASVDARSLGTPLGIGPSLENLALFFTHLPRSKYHLIDETLDAYGARRGWRKDPQLRSRLRHEVRKQVERQRKAWLKKAFRESTQFVCRRSWQRVVICRRADYSVEMDAFLSDPDPIVNAAPRVKDGNSATVAAVKINGVKMAVKRYNIKSFGHRLKRCVRPSRAAVSWKNSHLLAHLGVPTPKAVAFVERRWGPFRSSAYFVSEYVPGPDAHTLLHNPKVNASQADRMARLFAGLLQELADHRISHGDMKATNFILAQEHLWTLDLDAMRRHRWRSRFRRAFAEDLARLMENWGDLPAVVDAFRNRLGALKF